ncbi:alpha/beta fold hydrolase [uncultured Pseudacidovorax sp.]|uniref:alpha/beta fold hydrolase n=1 Tax=Pseudacidovorax intermedius TaxID=433924 RepID=UPI00345C260A
MSHTHITAPTQFIEAKGVRFAYRRFGAETGTPLVFLQHFRGGMDNWDPLVTDGLGQGRPVILVNYAGVASSGGTPATTVDGMADGIADFVQALGLPQVDVLGFSIGGFVAQSFTHRYPGLVRRLVLVGTGPRQGEANPDKRVMQVAGNPFRARRTSCTSSSRLPRPARPQAAHSGSAGTSARSRIPCPPSRP